MTEWRQGAHNVKQFKKMYRHVQKLKHSTSKDEDKRLVKEAKVKEAHREYLDKAREHLERARSTHDRLQECAAPLIKADLEELDGFIKHGERQIDQIRRRVLEGEAIPHGEKVFSLFQPHTEWISKGKAGVPVELGLRTCIVEDQHRFILHHRVMEKVTDDQIAVHIIEETRQRYGILKSISMDKGFHSKNNQIKLKDHAELVVLPKKGKLSVVEQARQSEPEFMHLRHQHSAVESAINALESHGLDLCRDHGIQGFKRYVALAVVARNIQRLGAILRQQEAERIRGPYKKAA